MAGPCLGRTIQRQEPLAPVLRRRIPKAHGLDDGNELQAFGAHLIPEKPIDLERLPGGQPVHAAQGGKVDPVFFKQPGRPEDPVEAPCPRLVLAVMVMQFFGAVEA